MLRLYGVPLSNYYNMVKVSLLEKRLPFAEVQQGGSQDAAYLAKSPMGKIPVLETDHGFISETRAILDYLEDAFGPPTPAFLPADPYARAKVRELTQCIELYLELVARRGFGVLFKRPVADEVKAGITTDITKNVATLKRLLAFSPWVAGRDMSYADFVLYYTLALGNESTKANAGIDLVPALGAEAWHVRMAARDSVGQADAASNAFRKGMGG